MSNKIKLYLLGLLAGIIMLGFYFVYLPFSEDITKLENEEAELSAILEENLEKITHIQSLEDKKIEKLEIMRNIASDFFGIWLQEEYYVKIKRMAEECELSIDSITYIDDQLIADSLEAENDPNTLDGENTEETSSEEEAEDTVQDNDEVEGVSGNNKFVDLALKSEYEMEFQGNYTQVSKFIQQIDNDGKYIACSELTISPEEEGDNLNCIVRISFYYLTKYDEYTTYPGYDSGLDGERNTRPEDANVFN